MGQVLVSTLAGTLSGERGVQRRAGRRAQGLMLLSAFVLASLVLSLREPPASPAAPAGDTDARALAAYSKLPLGFVRGDRGYSARGAGFTFTFSREQVLLAFTKGQRGHAVALRFMGASRAATLAAERKLPGTVNDLTGDRSAWRTDLPAYGEIVYRDLWKGIDMRLRGQAGTLKYEFHVAPGARVADIRLGYRGAGGISLARDGALLVRTPLGVLRDTAPRTYHLVGGRRVPVTSRYTVAGATYGFALPQGYDPARPLVIDPGLEYSTFLGGTGEDRGYGVAVDPRGNAYVTGDTFSPDFPTTPGSFDPTFNGTADVFVTKLNPAGSALVYSTFLGGTHFESGLDIVVDGRGQAFVAGQTFSPDYPTTPGAYDTTFNGGLDDAFVTKLNADGSSLVYSTFLGSSSRDYAFGIDIDGSGNAYVTGDTGPFSADFPTTPGAYDQTYNGGLFDAFVTKLNPDGSALVYSTFLGGSDRDDGTAIAVDQGGGSAHVVTVTSSADFPTTPGAYDQTYNGVSDGTATKLNGAGSALVYSTFLGGTLRDGAIGVAVDASGRAHVTGTTLSADFPATPGAFDPTFNGVSDAFATALERSGSALAYSTFLGGTLEDEGRDIDVTRGGRAYVTGITSSPDYPVTPSGFDPTFNGVFDAFVSKLDRAGSTLLYSTFLGGSSLDAEYLDGASGAIFVDQRGDAYVTGTTTSPDFPTTPGAYDQTFNGGLDAYVTKLDTGGGNAEQEDADG